MSRYFTILMSFIILIVLLMGCGSETNKTKNIKENEKGTTYGKNNKQSSQKQFEFSYEGQTFHIISLFDEVLNFTNSIQEDQAVDKEKVYHENVVKPFMTTTNHDPLASSNFFTYDTDIEKLKDNTTNLMENLDDINKIIKSALLKSAKELPGHDLKIIIMPINPDNYFPIYNMEGVAGVASNTGNVIIIQIDPSFNSNVLEHSIAHEYNHTVALKNSESETSKSFRSILDMILLEGKADVFAKMIYPNGNIPWIQPLPERDLKNVLKTLKENPNPYDSTIFTDLQYGTANFPKWSNYKFGYAIMESYLEKNSDVSPQEWTNLSTEEIIKNSNYHPLLDED